MLLRGRRRPAVPIIGRGTPPTPLVSPSSGPIGAEERPFDATGPITVWAVGTLGTHRLATLTTVPCTAARLIPFPTTLVPA